MPSMGFWLRLDQELIGDLDGTGCYHNSQALNAMLTEYGITEFEQRRTARKLMRRLGSGRASAMQD